jgi:hypothetical protein
MGAGDLAWATFPRTHAAAAHADLKPIRDLRAAMAGLVAQIVAAARRRIANDEAGSRAALVQDRCPSGRRSGHNHPLPCRGRRR